MCIGNEESKSLPLTKSLQLITYTGFQADGTNDHDSDEEVHGLIFIYREFDVIYVIEQDLSPTKEDRQAQIDALEVFKNMICQVIYTLNSKRHYNEGTKRNITQFCGNTSLDALLRVNDVFEAYPTINF